MRALIALILVSTAAMACGDPQSEHCRSVCRQETECAESKTKLDEDFPYDLEECIEACVRLERDNAGKILVDKHVECAKKAGDDCQALMDCRRP